MSYSDDLAILEHQRNVKQRCDEKTLDYIEDLEFENTLLKTELQALRELLKEIEFVDTPETESLYCPVCGWENGNHFNECWLKAQIDKLEESK